MVVQDTDDALRGIEPDERRERRNRRTRAVGLGLFAAIVLAGLAGCLGVRTATSAARSADGLEISVRHPAVARAGMPVALTVEVRHDDGFDGPITVAIPVSYLALFDENGRVPEAESSRSDGRTVSWTYEPPEGDVLAITFDIRVEPAIQWGRSATVTAETGGDHVEVDVRTWIAP